MKALQRKLLVILCVAVLLGTLTLNASAATFTDTAGHWAENEIQVCAQRGIVDGVGGNRFNPDGNVTNAAFVKMLCTAFFAQEQRAYELTNGTAMDAYFGGTAPWYGYRSFYFSEQGLLNGVDYNILSPISANTDMNRYNMAQAAANVLAQKGITATTAQKSAAQSAIGDFSAIPTNYRDAVVTCYSLKIINGINGQFVGGRTMTRAQACTVITRLMGAVGEGAVVTPDPTPTTPVTPDPVTPTEPDPTPSVKEVVVTGTAGSTNIGKTPTTPTGQISGTAWTVTDNKCGNGRLNNGKEITQENVVELLMKAETIWTDGMTWTGTAAKTGNNWYANAGSIMTNFMSGHGAGNKGGCNGYAAMISDYIFGSSSNPVRQTTVSNIRPGDIIIEMNGNRVVHHFIALSVPGGTYNKGTMTHDGYIHGTGGNESNKVSWPNEYSTPSSPNIGETWVVYTRYPN